MLQPWVQASEHAEDDEVLMYPCATSGSFSGAQAQKARARWAGLATAAVLLAAAAWSGIGRGSAPSSPAPHGEIIELAGLKSTGLNPFKDVKFYVNPKNRARYLHSIKTAKTQLVKNNLKKMAEAGVAWWIDEKDKINGNDTDSVEGILRDAAKKDKPELVVLIWYDVPNRDCDAKASTGEFCCTYFDNGTCDLDTQSTCSEGIDKYKTEYVDPFVNVLKNFSTVPVVIIMEPDSLANLATNTGHPHCGNNATMNAYRIGIKYAVDQLTTEVPKVKVYMDAAHGAWLGWGHNIKDFLQIMHNMSLPMHKIRGFATNVAKYQPLGARCPWEADPISLRNAFCLASSQGDKAQHAIHPCCEDHCGLLKAWNSGNNELNYAALLIRAAREKFGMDFKAIVDTGRNGVQKRSDCGNFCNIRNAGVGKLPTSHVADPDIIDAYFWMKTPGESDGCTEELPNGDVCPRFDKACASVDSLGNRKDEPKAPEAGDWYNFQALQLAHFANWSR